MKTRNALLFLSCLMSTGAAHAEMFLYVDAQGVTHVSNMPFDETVQQAVLAQDRPGSKERYAPIVSEAARENELDPALLHAVIMAESGYNPQALSRKGAQGMMQLLPETAKKYGVTDSYDPSQNIQGGARYLKYLLQLFDQKLELALAAYNAGENAVIRHGRKIPPYRETQEYVPKVLKLHKKFQNL